MIWDEYSYSDLVELEKRFEHLLDVCVSEDRSEEETKDMYIVVYSIQNRLRNIESTVYHKAHKNAQRLESYKEGIK